MTSASPNDDRLRFWLGPPGSQARKEGEALCLALAHNSDPQATARFAELYQQVGDQRMWEIAQREHMEGIVAHAIQRASLPTPERWLKAHAEVEATIREYMQQLDLIAARLAEAGIPVVALKNAGIARGLFPCLGCCPMGDLDLLVRRSDFVRAHEVMLQMGFNFEFRSPLEKADIEHAIRGGGTEYSFLLPSGRNLWVEIQWRPVAGRWIRPDQEPSGDDLVARSLPIPGTHARLLCPEDNLLQVALHTAKHSYIRAPGFRLHSDVDRIVRLQHVDWDRFLDSACASGVRTASHGSLEMASSLLGTPVPASALQVLRPSTFKLSLLSRWIRRAGVFSPDAPKFGRLGYLFFVALLYDGLLGALRSAIPNPSWMMRHYSLRSHLELPRCYLKRLFHSVTQRSL